MVGVLGGGCIGSFSAVPGCQAKKPFLVQTTNTACLLFPVVSACFFFFPARFDHPFLPLPFLFRPLFLLRILVSCLFCTRPPFFSGNLFRSLMITSTPALLPITPPQPPPPPPPPPHRRSRRVDSFNYKRNIASSRQAILIALASLRFDVLIRAPRRPAIKSLSLYSVNTIWTPSGALDVQAIVERRKLARFHEAILSGKSQKTATRGLDVHRITEQRIFLEEFIFGRTFAVNGSFFFPGTEEIVQRGQRIVEAIQWVIGRRKELYIPRGSLWLFNALCGNDMPTRAWLRGAFGI